MTDARSPECAACQGKLHDFAFGVLEAAEADAVSAHVAACAVCGAVLAKEREWAALIHEMPDHASEATDAEVGADVQSDMKARRRHRMSPWLAVLLVCAFIYCVFLFASVTGSLDAWIRGTAVEHLKSIAVAFRLYADDANGLYPPLAPVADIFVPDLRLLFPRFVQDPCIFVNPRLPDLEERTERLLSALEETPPNWDAAHRVIAEGYVYLPWATKDLEDFTRFAERFPSAEDRDSDLPGDDETDVVYRLREGVDRFFITAEAMAPPGGPVPHFDVPILFEVVQLQEKKRLAGCNVLYLDGHVEFIRYGERYPIVREVAEFLAW